MTPSANSWIGAMKRTAPRISDWMWPLLSPLRIQSSRNGSQAASARIATRTPAVDEDPHRLVAGVDAEDREAVAADVGPGRAEQPRLAGLRVGLDRDLVDRDEHLAGLDHALERVGEVVDDEQPERGLAVVGAEPGGRVGDLGPREPSARPSCPAAAAPSCCRRSARSDRPARSPTTMSASPARIGATSLTMSAPRYWLSASVLTMTSAPSLRQASRPAWNAAASPLLLVSRTMCSTPVLARDLDGAVGRAVVDDQQLDRVEAVDLARQLGDRRRQGGLLVEAGDLDDQLHAGRSGYPEAPSAPG